MVLSLDLVDVVKTLSLNQTVEEGTSETSEELLRLRVAVGGTVLSNVLLVGLGSLRDANTLVEGPVSGGVRRTS